MIKRVALGLSGGVDSAVSAYLLKKQGFDISCIYLSCYDNNDPQCRAKTDRADALKVALHLNLSFQVLDFRQEYQAAVIDYFKSEYLSGRTPNPDVVCNRDIKFGLFLDWAIKNGFDYVATGHYAKIVTSNKKQVTRKSQPPSDLSLVTCNLSLARPLDERKDQTYFLWQVPRQKFQRVLFPLADYLKSEVRDIARKIKLPVADKKDSTGICFVGEIGVKEFLKRLGVKEKIGEVTLSNGKVIGRHKGVWFYTIGQRHGFTTDGWFSNNSRISVHSRKRVGSIRDKAPLYIISKDIKHNRLVVGFGPECYRDSFEVSQCNWLTASAAPEKAWPLNLPGTPGRPGLKKLDCLVRLRHCGDLIPAVLERSDLSRRGQTLKGFSVRLSSPQRGIAPGQSAVFYTKNGTVLGGGVIQ